MGRKTALVDYNLCQPAKCEACSAAEVCNRRLLVQESPSTPPLTDPSVCRGCGDCVRACPLKAVSMTTL
jgi:translation initiation factor RLI1